MRNSSRNNIKNEFDVVFLKIRRIKMGKLRLLRGFWLPIAFALIWTMSPIGIMVAGAAPPTIVQIDNPSPETNAHFGSGVSGLSDINGDGVGDFAVGARGAERVYLFSGADYSIIDTIEGPDGVDWPYWFGNSVRGVGDVDGDSIEDLAVGAPYNIWAGGLLVPCYPTDDPTGGDPCPPFAHGEAFVFSGATGALLFRVEQVEREYSFDNDGDGVPDVVYSARSSMRLGATLAPLGDVNGDGIPDVAVGEGTKQSGGLGTVYAFSGADGRCLWVTREPTDKQGLPSFGIFMAEVGDLTGDGSRNLLVAAPWHDYDPDPRDQLIAGRGYILSGSDGTIFRIHDNPSPVQGDEFGRVPSAIGDQDGDGVEDYAFGSPDNAFGPPHAGRVHIYSGASGSTILDIASPGDGSTDGFGSSIARLSDMCGDGPDCFWVAAPMGGTVYLMNNIGEIITQIDDLDPVEGPPYYRLSATRDLDGDGAQDLIIGRPGNSVDGNEEAGNVFLVLTRPVFATPDVFDDEDSSTPAPGGWPRERNDSFEHRTRLVLPPDPLRMWTGIHYFDLNLEGVDDQDYFQVILPEDPDTCPLLCGDDVHAKKLVVTVISDYPVNVTFLSPDDGLPIYPYSERWERSVGDGSKIIEITCPQEARATGARRVATEDREVSFYIEPDGCRTDYDLRIGYHYLQRDYCELPSQPEWRIMEFIGWRIEEPVYSIFPGLKAFWDCESNPACDPAEEYIAVKWLGGNLEMQFHYTSPAKEGTFTISLLNAAGDVLGTAEPVQLASAPAKVPPEDSNVQGELALLVKDLHRGWYFLQIDGPFPTLFSYHFTLTDIFLALDIKPQSCPNPLNVRSRGVLPAAILGTEGFDVTQVDVSTVHLEDVSPLRSALEDVATPFEPFVGKEEKGDCTTKGPNGFLDLTLKFDQQEVVKAIEDSLERPVKDGEVVVLTLTGNLREEFGGTPIRGEDVVVIVKKGKPAPASLTFSLGQNFSNPSNPDTWIPYTLADNVDVVIRIYSLSGQLVRILNLGHQPAGRYTTKAKAAYWDGRSSFGEKVASGVYYYTLETGEFRATRKMVILK